MGQFVKGDVVIIPFTADKNMIISVAGRLSETKTRAILDAVIAIISS